MIWVWTIIAGVVLVGLCLLAYVVKIDIEADFNPTRDHLEKYNEK